MSPPRKSRSANKQYVNEVSPFKHGAGSKRHTQRKKKLSLLGPHWSKEELIRFYDAYRKHGKDWKKVAAAVRNRSVDMVEALYSMNMAYLSLPEGTASVVGLIAMMTDHYCNMAGSDSEQESNEGEGTSQKPQKLARSKVQAVTSKGTNLQFPAPASNYGCLALLKKKRSGTRLPVVGKRTPRFPVPHSHKNVNDRNYFCSSRQGLKRKLDTNDDDEVAHEIAIALAEASKRGRSPQVSETPTCRGDSALSTPARKAEKRQYNLEMVNSKPFSCEMDEDEGSMEADTGELHRNKTSVRETGRTMRKRRRLSGKKLENDVTGDNHFDEIKEACSGTEEGYRLGVVREKSDMDVSDERVSWDSSLGVRKRSKKVLFQRDESTAFDALQTLAALSLMMPTSENENELVIPTKDENDHFNDESDILGALPPNQQKEKHGSSGVKANWNQPISVLKNTSSAISNHGNASVDTSTIPETKQARKTQKISTSKAHKGEGEVHLSSDLSEPQEFVTKDTLKKLFSKVKKSSQSSPKLIKNQDHSSSSDIKVEKSDSAQSTAELPVSNQRTFPTKVRSRRKMGLKKPKKEKDLTFPDSVLDNHRSLPFLPVNDKVLSVKNKLFNCLSNHCVRRWCTYEWFYSAIDYPWFAKREFVEYLYHVGLGHVPRLTRVEWGVIKSSLGKPRRFSEQFLKEEKEKLNRYREFVRTHYTELRESTRVGLPTDLARPLSVGQRVIAIHPKTREIHDGSVLTVDHSRCLVQFDWPELGVENVKDIDCMPLNPYDNMPALLSRERHALENLFENFNDSKANDQANDNVKLASGDNMENGECFSSSLYAHNNLFLQKEVFAEIPDGHAKVEQSDTVEDPAYSQPIKVSQNQSKEADVQALAKLSRALNKKDAVICELRRMNDDVLENQQSGDCTLKDSDQFRKQYAAIIVQLNEVNEQVSSALCCLRQRNTYQGNGSLSWPRPFANFGDSGGISDSYTNEVQELGSHISEIIESSKVKARTMVDAAVQAISSLNGVEYGEGDVEDANHAIDYLNSRIPTDELCLPSAPDSKLRNTLHGNERDLPLELIAQCVATLLMIQKCTERQFPPADVAKILDSAVTSLHPSASNNLPLYAEIEKCMGIVRNQILALIPT